MWIKNVDVPPELISAAEAGRLVIFVGAGASIDAPSSLPSFDTLVKTIRERVAPSSTKDDLSAHEKDLPSPDVLLGELEDSETDVHRLVFEEINGVNSQPNKLHEALMRLATAYGSPRVVTTNYDRHLEDAAPCEIRVYEGPAVPLGDDFEGIVHLHGSLNQDARHLIVTDIDFGSAYLSDAWAARFLDRMFSKYTVLFVGYSHGDMVMRYLARSLGSRGERYICTFEPDKPEWKSYGLHPIAYELDGESHQALTVFIARWAELATMGQLDHRERISNLIKAGPPSIPEDISYLEDSLTRPERLRYFVESAKTLDWLEWTLSNSNIREMLENANPPNLFKILSSWILETYAHNEEISHRALKLASQFQWSQEFALEVIHKSPDISDFSSSPISLWTLRAVCLHFHSNLPLLDIFSGESIPVDKSNIAIALFRQIITPSFSIHSWPPIKDSLDLEASINTDDYALQEAWSNLMRPLLETKTERLLSVLSDQISSLYWHHQILDSSFDPISFHRSAIEDHEQDFYLESVDVIINAIRDCLEFALTNDPTIANAYIKLWEIRPESIFKRLALHAYRVRDDISGNEKLRWLIEKNWLWDPYLRHETYYLLSDNVSECDADVIEALLQHARATVPNADEGTSDRYLYDLLEWLYQHIPHNQLICTSWSKERDLHPEWAPRPHPDFLYWMTVGDETTVPALSPDTLVRMINENPHEAASKLRLLSSSTETEQRSPSSSIRSTIQTCVARAPKVGLLLSKALSDEDADLQQAIIRGWAASDLDLETAERVLQTISEWNVDNIRRVATSMLQGDSNSSGSTIWCQIPASQGLAKRLWPETTIRGAIRDGDDDLLTEAINHPAGQLASFWIKVIQHEWETAGDNWQGISSDFSHTLLKMLHDTSRNGVLAEVILAADLGFLLSADSDWTKRQLIPRFNWTVNPESAAYAWQGFLRVGRPGDRLLDSDFLEHYLDTCAHLEDLPNNLEKRLATHLAQITAFGSIDPADYLTTFIKRSPETLILSWIREITLILSRMDADKTTYQWDRWIRDYWSMRYRTIPHRLSIDENSAMAGWLPHLEPVISNVAPLFVATPARLYPGNGLLARISECDLGEHGEAWIRILTHLLENTESTSPAIQHQLPRIVSKLREAQNESRLELLINQALRLEVPLAKLQSENDAPTNQ